MWVQRKEVEMRAAQAIAALADDVPRIHSVQRAAYAERLTAIEGEVLDDEIGAGGLQPRPAAAACLV